VIIASMIILLSNCRNGVMVSMLTLSAVDHGLNFQ